MRRCCLCGKFIANTSIAYLAKNKKILDLNKPFIFDSPFELICSKCVEVGKK